MTSLGQIRDARSWTEIYFLSFRRLVGLGVFTFIFTSVAKFLGEKLWDELRSQLGMQQDKVRRDFSQLIQEAVKHAAVTNPACPGVLGTTVLDDGGEGISQYWMD